MVNGTDLRDETPFAQSLTTQTLQVAFITLGCAKNEVDTEKMRARVAAAGMQLTDDAAVADCVVLNTCAFITEAIEESIGFVIELIELPRIADGSAKLVVVGCMPSRFGDELAGELPEVAAFVAVKDEQKIAEVILAACEGVGAVAVSDAVAAAQQVTLASGSGCMPVASRNSAAFALEKPVQHTALALPTRIAIEQRPWAYLKIADGCSRRCSYCTIPEIRGSYEPTPLAQLLAEADELVAGGARELVLIAQDTGLWSERLPSAGGDTCGAAFDDDDALSGVSRTRELALPDLLEQLATRYPDTWIRIMYLQPSALSDRLLQTMAAHANIAPYLDIPLQHASPRVLADMNRSGSSDEFLALLARVRAALPGVTIRTTVMAGFPGETRAEALELEQFIQAAEFDYVGVFAYSAEAGTVAGERSDQVPMRTRQARAQRLRDLADAIGFRRAEAMIGQKLAVLVTEYEDGQPIGRHMGQSPEVDGVVRLDRGEPGQVVLARVTDSICYDLDAVVE